jgi:hypothetical protein
MWKCENWQINKRGNTIELNDQNDFYTSFSFSWHLRCVAITSSVVHISTRRNATKFILQQQARLKGAFQNFGYQGTGS